MAVSERTVPTVVVSRRARPGFEREFEAWIHRLHTAANEAPGHLRSDVRAPNERHPDDWTIVYQFESVESREKWINSPERRTLLDEGHELVDGEASELPFAPAFVDLVGATLDWFTASGALPERVRVGESVALAANVQVLDPGSAAPEPATPVPDSSVKLPSPAVPGPGTGETSRPDDVREVLALVNAERTAAGVAPLTMHPQLTEAALAHAADQYDFNCLTSLTHTGTDGSNPAKRITRTGFLVRTWGENIACNQRTPAEAMRGWMNSPGHRQNVLRESFTHIGISITVDSRGQPYWMQVFGTAL